MLVCIAVSSGYMPVSSWMHACVIVIVCVCMPVWCMLVCMLVCIAVVVCVLLDEHLQL